MVCLHYRVCSPTASGSHFFQNKKRSNLSLSIIITHCDPSVVMNIIRHRHELNIKSPPMHSSFWLNIGEYGYQLPMIRANSPKSVCLRSWKLYHLSTFRRWNYYWARGSLQRLRKSVKVLPKLPVGSMSFFAGPHNLPALSARKNCVAS